jgi:hypothetical protein
MKDIFLSRPNWVPKICENGLNNFYNLLKVNDLNPRTIGQSDYPNKSPLEEVIDLMKKCQGTIVLGIPQTEIIKGKIKGKETKEIIELGTEWNHIEAALAHSIGQPLLIIHHLNVQRGIFDKGACNSFLYKIDFNDPTWPLSNEISGALLSWKTRLNEPSINLKEKNDNNEPILQWGMYKFPGEPGLYCPVCYKKDGLKIPASRINSKYYQCPNCNAKLS